jgi:hypothetical protein
VSDALRALADGDLAAFDGLPDGLTRASAEAALGPSDPPRDFGGRLAGEPRVFRHFAPTAAAPAGIDVWLDGERVVAVTIEGAAPRTLPGEPEAEARRPDGTRALVHASRGLTLHVTRGGVVERVLAYRACTPEEFLAGPLARD